MAEIVYRYRVKGRIPVAVLDEIRRGHILRNEITEAYRAADEQIAELLAAQPEVAAAQLAAGQAAEQVKIVTEQLQARKSAQRVRRPDSVLVDRLEAARSVAREARDALRTARAEARRRLKEQEQAIRGNAHAAVKALYPLAVSGALYEDSPVPGGLYWATCNLITRQQRAALDRVIERRSQDRPAELGYRRWDGGGTIAVQLARSIGVSQDERARIAELTAARARPGVIAASLAAEGYPARTARTIGRIVKAAAAGKEPPPQRPADPPRSPWRLASGGGRWRNVLQLRPYRTEAERAALPPAERKRAELMFRVGSGDTAAMPAVRIVMDRPLPDNADVAMMQFTVSRITSTRVRAHVALTVRVPDARPPAGGRLAAVHTGWRVLDDGAIRVAVVTGVPSPPSGIGLIKDARAARARHQARGAGVRSGIPGRPWAGTEAGERESGLRDHGSWQEIVIPAQVRDLDGHARSLQSIRSREMDQARAAIAAHLAAHPASKEMIDPDGTLDRWRSPRRFCRVIEAMEAQPAVLSPDQAALLDVLREWREQEQHLEGWQAYERRRHITGWRRDMYRQVAAWLAGSASVIVMDSWPAARVRPAADEEDTAQLAAARANAVLAAPGELRQAVKAAAARRGVALRESPGGASGVHHGCPAGQGELPADGRARALMVTCRGCGRRVDQDRNTLAAMITLAGAVR